MAAELGMVAFKLERLALKLKSYVPLFTFLILCISSKVNMQHHVELLKEC